MATQEATKQKMKDSGVEWIGEIPDGWDVLPVRSVLEERKEKNLGNKIDNILSVMKDVGVIRYEDKGNVGNKSSDRPENYKIVYPGDIVANSMNLVIGSVGLSQELGVTSSVYLIYHPKEKKTDVEYFYYLFRTKEFQKHLGTFGRGMMELREAVKSNDVKVQRVPVPSQETQKEIADFLDEKTEKVDRVIEKKKKLIEILKEKRSSLITCAVTKGLDPNVKMKDSGVEWIGDIPGGWSNYSFRHILDKNEGGVWGGEDFFGKGKEVLRSTEIAIDGSWKIKNPAIRLLTSKEYKSFKIEEGDFLLTKSSGSRDHLGKTALVTKDIAQQGYAYSTYMQRLRFKNEMVRRYLFFVLNSSVVNEQIIYWGTTTSGLVNLNRTLINNFQIPVPTQENQKQIADFLDEKTGQIDKTIQKIQSQINKLQEYKSSLIYHAVTGKIKI